MRSQKSSYLKFLRSYFLCLDSSAVEQGAVNAKGSNPFQDAYLVMFHWTSWLSRRPFTSESRVRIPYGIPFYGDTSLLGKTPPCDGEE